VLTNYKKQLNLSAGDIQRQDYFDKLKEVHDDTARTLRETRPEQFTKEFTMRLRLKRDTDAPYQKAGQEYGNYEQYEKNKVETHRERDMVDEGEPNFF